MSRTLARKTGVVVALCLIGALVSPAPAALEVLYDTGKTESLLPLYLRAFNRDGPNGTHRTVAPPSSVPFSLADVLPVRSEGLTPGLVRRRPLPRPIPINQPLFLVGSDEQSLRWLQTNRARLEALEAIGLIVEVDTLEALRVIAVAGRGLRMTLGAAGDLARALGLAHYPVLISSEGIEQ